MPAAATSAATPYFGRMLMLPNGQVLYPSPGFTFYEDATGQPVAEAIADLLARGMPDV